MFLNKKFNFDNTIRIIFITIICVALFFLLRYLSPVLSPFVFALFLFYFLNPVVEFFDKIIKNRVISVWVTILLIVSIFTTAIFFIIPKINKELIETHNIILKIIQDDSVIKEKVSNYSIMSYFVEKIHLFIIGNPTLNYIFNEESFKTLSLELVKKIFPTLMSLVVGTANFFIWVCGIFIVFLYLFFMLFGYKRLKEDVMNLLPKKIKEKILEFFRTFNDAMDNYFKGQLTVAFCVGILFTIAFLIVDLPMAILLGIFFGVLNIIPYMQIFGYIPAIILSIFKSLQTGMPIWQSLLYTFISIAIVQMIQDTILVPKIIGKKMGINPVMIILSLSIWGKLFGVFGFLIAIPITCLTLEYYKKLISKYE
jgi:predicted PurR-regulated permease PerM